MNFIQREKIYIAQFRACLGTSSFSKLSDNDISAVWVCLLYDYLLDRDLVRKNYNFSMESVRALRSKAANKAVVTSNVRLNQVIHELKESHYTRSLNAFRKATESMLAFAVNKYAKDAAKEMDFPVAKRLLPKLIKIRSKEIALIFCKYCIAYPESLECRAMLVFWERRTEERNISRILGNTEEKMLRAWIANKRNFRRIQHDFKEKMEIHLKKYELEQKLKMREKQIDSQRRFVEAWKTKKNRNFLK